LTKLEVEPSQVSLRGLNWTLEFPPSRPINGMLRENIAIALPSFGATL